ncbi:MAG: ATP phosphoribosyltransferase regulatory subunit, partial [Pseudomonadota bacterium]
VLRVDRDQLRPERQFAQVGAEIIGGDRLEGDVEILVMCVEALAAAGVRGVTVDLSAPTLVDAALAPFTFDAALSGRIRDALDHKDAAAAARAAGPAAALVEALIRANGPLDRAAAALEAIDLATGAAEERDQLVALGRALRAAAPDLPITIDPAERNGFHYHAGPSFSLFAQGVRGELGRGGRYRVGAAGEEAAIGATLYIDTVSRAAPRSAPSAAVYLPHGAPADAAAALRAEGRVTIAGLAPEPGDPADEAQRLGCAALWTPKGVAPV